MVEKSSLENNTSGDMDYSVKTDKRGSRKTTVYRITVVDPGKNEGGDKSFGCRK